jgi:hypothetical protein
LPNQIFHFFHDNSQPQPSCKIFHFCCKQAAEWKIKVFINYIIYIYYPHSKIKFVLPQDMTAYSVY